MTNRTIPKLRFKGFHNKWILIKLRDISKIKAGGDVNKKKLSTSGQYPVLSNGLNKDGIIGYYPDYKIKAPAITVTGRGKLGIAKARFISFTPVVRLISVQSKKLDTIFGANAINQIHIFKESTGVPQLTAKQLKEYKIKVPSLLEQQQIGKFFATLDKLIQLQQKKVSLLKKLKRGYLQKLFPRKGESTPRLRFKGFHGKWNKTVIKDVAKYRRGSFPQPYGNPKWYQKDGYPFVQVVDVSNNFKLVNDTHRKISKIAANKSMFAPKGTILITIQGSIGRVAISQYDAYIDRTLLVITNLKPFVNKYFFVLSMSIIFNKKKHIAPGGTIKTITKHELSNFILLLPSLLEQQMIGKLFENLDRLINNQAKKLMNLHRLKSAYLQKMFC